MGSLGTGDGELGDARRTRRPIKLVEALAAAPTGSIPLASGGWAETKAAYRLLDNEALDWRELLEVHTRRTVGRMQGQPVVLGLQDTTALDFTSQPGIAGLGRLSDDAQHGLYVPPTVVVTPAGMAVGVLEAWRWARGPKERLAVQDSTRWVEGYRAAGGKPYTSALWSGWNGPWSFPHHRLAHPASGHLGAALPESTS